MVIIPKCVCSHLQLYIHVIIRHLLVMFKRGSVHLILILRSTRHFVDDRWAKHTFSGLHIRRKNKAFSQATSLPFWSFNACMSAYGRLKMYYTVCMWLEPLLSVRLKEVSTYERCPLAEVRLYIDSEVFYG